MVNVGTYTSPMDPLGYKPATLCESPFGRFAARNLQQALGSDVPRKSHTGD